MRIEHWLYAVPRWLRGVFQRQDVEHELEDELRYHIEQQTAANLARGMSPDEARRAALAAFGGVERIKDESRDARRLSIVDTVAQDLTSARRVVTSSPGFALAVSATLALGIGATATMFGVVDRLLLRPPSHVVGADRLRRVYATLLTSSHQEVTASSVGYVIYTTVRQAGHLLDGVAAYSYTGTIIGSGADARQVDGAAATAGFFPLLGVRASVGRLFTAAEDDPRTPSNVVVLDHDFWQREYGGAMSALGSILTIYGKPFTIIGVLPAGFTGTELRKVDFWTPMSSAQHPKSDWSTTWQAQWLFVIVRSKPGIDPGAASREITAALHNAVPPGSGAWPTARFTVRPIAFDQDGNEPAVYAVARWLTAVALVVLLIACTNVVNLLLARSLSRRREIAVRLALGISRSRLLRLLVTESLVLATLGGVGGVLVAYGGAELIRRRFLPDLVWDSSPVNQRVLVVAALLTFLVGVLTGILPALQAGRTDVVSSLKAGARGSGGTPRQARLRSSLLIAQSALAVALLVTAGLFIRSLINVRALDLGFEPDRVLSVGIQWPRGGDAKRQAADWERIRRHVASLPDYEHAALAIGTPFGNAFGVTVRVPGRDSLPTLGGPYVAPVSPDYFTTVGTRLVQGRLFAASEGPGTEPVTIVSETMARALWPRESAIGRCLLIGDGNDVPCARIVGVVRDARRSSLHEEPVMQYYIPIGQERGIGGTELLVRPRGAAKRAVAAVRAVIAQDAPAARFIRVRSMQDRIDPLMRPWRLGAGLFGLFGALAMIVAATGLYSVVAYVTTQRMHEFGVRIALGARGAHLSEMVITGALRLALAGAAIGAGISLVAGHWLEPLLFNESARDPLVIGLVIGTLLLVSVLASFAPARRATRVDPLTALRAD